MMTEKEYNDIIIPLRDKMFRFARAILITGNSSELAEDVVHDVLETLWRKRNNLDECKRVESFVMTSVKNKCYDLIRHDKARMNCDINYENINEDSAQWDMRKILSSVLNTLPDRQREIIHLKDIEGYETYEISEIMSIGENNVRAILSRSRKELKKRIENIMDYGTK